MIIDMLSKFCKISCKEYFQAVAVSNRFDLNISACSELAAAVTIACLNVAAAKQVATKYYMVASFES